MWLSGLAVLISRHLDDLIKKIFYLMCWVRNGFQPLIEWKIILKGIKMSTVLLLKATKVISEISRFFWEINNIQYSMFDSCKNFMFSPSALIIGSS